MHDWHIIITESCICGAKRINTDQEKYKVYSLIECLGDHG